MDFEFARESMIEQQIRTWGVKDERVLDAIRTVKRERFVPPALRFLALADLQVPLGFGQVMLAPKMEAKILQALAPQKHEKVLEVGAGSGHMAALFSTLAQMVHSVEIIPQLYEMAIANLEAQQFATVFVELGNAATGWARHAPYDVICITGALDELPDTFLSELKTGGRLFAFLGTAPTMQATLLHKNADGTIIEKSLFETVVPPLLEAPQKETFEF